MTDADLDTTDTRPPCHAHKPSGDTRPDFVCDLATGHNGPHFDRPAGRSWPSVPANNPETKRGNRHVWGAQFCGQPDRGDTEGRYVCALDPGHDGKHMARGGHTWGTDRMAPETAPKSTETAERPSPDHRDRGTAESLSEARRLMTDLRDIAAKAVPALAALAEALADLIAADTDASPPPCLNWLQGIGSCELEQGHTGNHTLGTVTWQ